MSTPTPQQILDLSMQPNSSGATTVRGYLVALLAELWKHCDDFSAKRPFGMSGWPYDLAEPLVRAGFAKGSFTEHGELELDRDEWRAIESLIASAIEALRSEELAVLERENEMHRERLRELGPIIAWVTENDIPAELKNLRAKVAQYEAGAAFTVHGGDRISDAQMWRMLLDASAESRLTTLGAMVENGWAAKRCQDEGHADRPTREAFDEVCRSVELQRRALVRACLITEGVENVSFDELLKHVRDVMTADMLHTARAEERSEVSSEVVDTVAARLLRIKLYGQHLEPRYDIAARKQWDNQLDDDERQWWRDEARALLAIGRGESA